MIPEVNRKGIKKAYLQHKRAKEKLEEAKSDLLYELKAARAFGARLRELGVLLGVSKQRVSQMLKED